MLTKPFVRCWISRRTSFGSNQSDRHNAFPGRYRYGTKLLGIDCGTRSSCRSAGGTKARAGVITPQIQLIVDRDPSQIRRGHEAHERLHFDPVQFLLNQWWQWDRFAMLQFQKGRYIAVVVVGKVQVRRGPSTSRADAAIEIGVLFILAQGRIDPRRRGLQRRKIVFPVVTQLLGCHVAVLW